MLAPRNRALEHSKAGQFRAAISGIDSVYEQALLRADQGQLGDAQERLETLHQISLAAVGILVSTVEGELAVRTRPGDEVFVRYVRAMLDWRDLLGRYLQDLLTHVQGLPQYRHQDAHIFWKDWVVTTHLNRMRAGMLGHLAFEAVCGTSADEFTLGIDALSSEFAAALMMPELKKSDQGSMYMQGTLLAALGGGRLRTIREPSAIVSAWDPQLLVGPDEHLGEPPTLEFRWQASADWHRRRRDAGFLGRLTRRSRAWSHLSGSGRQGFIAWYEALEGAGLTATSGRTDITRL
jgi:hypothetical protein